MPDMKPCFGKEIAVRFAPGTMPIGTDPETARNECYSCPDFEHCAIVVNLTLELRRSHNQEKGKR